MRIVNNCSGPCFYFSMPTVSWARDWGLAQWEQLVPFPWQQPSTDVAWKVRMPGTVSLRSWFRAFALAVSWAHFFPILFLPGQTCPTLPLHWHGWCPGKGDRYSQECPGSSQLTLSSCGLSTWLAWSHHTAVSAWSAFLYAAGSSRVKIPRDLWYNLRGHTTLFFPYSVGQEGVTGEVQKEGQGI